MALVVLLVQAAVIRPVPTGRSDRVSADEDAHRSVGNHWYVAVEVIKVVARFTSGVGLSAI